MHKGQSRELWALANVKGVDATRKKASPELLPEEVSRDAAKIGDRHSQPAKPDGDVVRPPPSLGTYASTWSNRDPVKSTSASPLITIIGPSPPAPLAYS